MVIHFMLVTNMVIKRWGIKDFVFLALNGQTKFENEWNDHFENRIKFGRPSEQF